MEIFKVGILKSTLLKNISDFISSLTIIDIVFFFSVILLMILLVTLLYFIKLNEDVYEENEKTIEDNTVLKTDNEPVTNALESTSLAYINDDNNINSFSYSEPVNMVVKGEEPSYSDVNYNENYNDEEGELLDLKSITKALENNTLNPVDLDEFEEQQEREAIISYDELVRKQKDFNNYVNNVEVHNNPNKYSAKRDVPTNISYKKESYIDDVSVKEVDLDSLISETNSLEANASTVYNSVISYQEEEEFLKVLKELQNNLN